MELNIRNLIYLSVHGCPDISCSLCKSSDACANILFLEKLNCRFQLQKILENKRQNIKGVKNG